VKVRKLGADSLDSLYTALKKCSRLCGRLPKTEHHTAGASSSTPVPSPGAWAGGPRNDPVTSAALSSLRSVASSMMAAPWLVPFLFFQRPTGQIGFGIAVGLVPAEYCSACAAVLTLNYRSRKMAWPSDTACRRPQAGMPILR
jgi:hypothetical protein